MALDFGNKVSNNGATSGGKLSAEEFNALVAAVNGNEEALGGKVDKEDGKGLSSNDYTTDEKNKLANIAADANHNVQSDWDESNASSDAYIKNKPAIPVVPSNVSAFTNDAGYLTRHQDLSSLADGAEYDSNGKMIYLKHGSTRLPNPIDATAFIKDGMVNNVDVVNGSLVITFNTDSGKEPISILVSEIFDASIYYTKSEVDTALEGKQDAISDLAAIRSGAGAGATAYQKPVGGIPKSDLQNDVQVSLEKADTALQSFSETDPTVPAWAKQSTKPSYSYSEITDKPAIPDELSDLSDDTTHRTVTDAEKSDWNGKADNISKVTVATSGAVSQVLSAGVFYEFTGALTSLTLSLAATTLAAPIYAGKFTADSSGCTLVASSPIVVGSDVPEIEDGESYEFNIFDNVLLMIKL